MSRSPLRYPLAVVQTCVLIVLMAVLRGPAYAPTPAPAIPAAPARLAARVVNISDVDALVPAATRASLAERRAPAPSTGLAVASRLASPGGWLMAGTTTLVAVGLGLWRRGRGTVVER